MTDPRSALPRRAFMLGGISATAALAVGCGGGGGSEATTASTTDTAVDQTPETTATTNGFVAPDGPARFVVNGPRDTDAVALTFHTNGDLDLALQMLDALDRYGAVATNFIIGDWLTANPSWAGRLTDAGMELANHSYTHPSFAGLSPDQMADEIGRTRDLLVDLTGQAGGFFRPSGTPDGTSEPARAILTSAGDAGYTTVLGWDVEPFDYEDPGASLVTERVLAGARGGSIVSLHFGHPGTVEALEPILAGFEERGLRTVTAGELLAGN